MVWKKVTIESLAECMTDGPFGSDLKTCHYTDKKEARIIQLSNVGEDGWVDENIKYTTFSHAQELSRCIVQPGDVIIAKMMPAGRAIICPNHELMYIQGSDVVKFVPNKLIDSMFFVYMTKQKNYLAQIDKNTQGSTRARTSISKLKKITLEIPTDITEQKRIAKILSTCDEVIFNTQKIIKKYKAVKQGLMQDLFSRGLTEDGKLRPTYKEAPELYKQSELGVIPKDWEIEDISSFGQIITGSTPSTTKDEYYGDSYHFISPADITEDEVFIFNSEKKLSDLGINVSRKIPKGSICTVCIGSTIGKCAVTTTLCCSNQQINSLIPFDFNLSMFLYYSIIWSTPKQFRANVGLQAVPIVNKSQFDKFKLIKPSYNEMIAISKRLSKIDSIIQKEESILSKYRKIKDGLMDKLLTN